MRGAGADHRHCVLEQTPNHVPVFAYSSPGATNILEFVFESLLESRLLSEKLTDFEAGLRVNRKIRFSVGQGAD